MKQRRFAAYGAAAVSAVLATTLGRSTRNDAISQAEKTDKDPPGFEQTKAIAEEAYLYGFPMIAAYSPDGPIYMVMRLYWPKTHPPSILPPGAGTWAPPPVQKAG